MGGFAPRGHAKLDPQHPAAFANCEMCGFLYNNRDLKWEVQWTGMEIKRTGHLVCPRCWDTPNYTIRAKTLPPDPVPILNPRSEPVHKHVRRWPGEPFPLPYEDIPGAVVPPDPIPPIPPIPPVTWFPGPSNTGCRIPISGLSNVGPGGRSTTADGQVMSGLYFPGPGAYIDIRHNNVTVRDCIVNGADIFGVGTTGTHTGVVVEYVTVIGGAATSAGMDIEGDGVEIRFCNISHCENGISLGGPNHYYHDNYIWGLMRTDVPIDVPHFDGIQTAGTPLGVNFRVIHNTIISRDTSCVIARISSGETITVQDNLFGSDPTLPLVPKPLAYGLLVNALAPGAGTANVTGNHFVNVAAHIFPLEFDGVTSVTCTGNIDDATSATVPPIFGPPV